MCVSVTTWQKEEKAVCYVSPNTRPRRWGCWLETNRKTLLMTQKVFKQKWAQWFWKGDCGNTLRLPPFSAIQMIKQQKNLTLTKGNQSLESLWVGGHNMIGNRGWLMEESASSAQFIGEKKNTSNTHSTQTQHQTETQSNDGVDCLETHSPLSRETQTSSCNLPFRLTAISWGRTSQVDPIDPDERGQVKPVTKILGSLWPEQVLSWNINKSRGCKWFLVTFVIFSATLI